MKYIYNLDSSVVSSNRHEKMGVRFARLGDRRRSCGTTHEPRTSSLEVQAILSSFSSIQSLL